MFLPAALVAATLLPAQPAAPPKFEIKAGDRIVWIGGTLVEREQRYGYWETALHAAFPDKQFTLRNLGWSGDTVWGEARSRFDHDKPQVYFRQLVDQTLALKPTVIFVSYGTNESFEGEAGLPKFEKGLNQLLDALKPANARVVLFTPLPFRKSASLADPTIRNRELARYADVIRRVAKERGAGLADLYRDGNIFISASEEATGRSVSENGIHLTEDGYQSTDQLFLMSLCGSLRDFDSDSLTTWQKLDPLRKAIVAKNQLFFYRWRPQNETYLFGFRKHEQGKNAKEVAEFDPLVSKAEEDIETIRKTLK